jgi:ketosteroid isomerase-like protein
MSENKRTVARYIDGFSASDHELILSCLTDDVVWSIPGEIHAVGKEAFDKEIENEAFVGSPAITITRMTEEDDVVVAEGLVRAQKKAGGFVNLVFCDVFVMQQGRIKRVTSYLVAIK